MSRFDIMDIAEDYANGEIGLWEAKERVRAAVSAEDYDEAVSDMVGRAADIQRENLEEEDEDSPDEGVFEEEEDLSGPKEIPRANAADVLEKLGHALGITEGTGEETPPRSEKSKAKVKRPLYSQTEPVPERPKLTWGDEW